MSLNRTATSVPKHALVRALLKTLAEDVIRISLHIAADTSLSQRLMDFTKVELLSLLTSTAKGEKALAEAEHNYPLSSSPTLYLVKVQHRPEATSLAENTAVLAEAGRRGGLQFGETRAVRAVYVASPAYELTLRGSTEIPILYERRLEYTVCDPESDEYGERMALYSLEQAFVWVLDAHSHAIIACPDFVAVRPIIDLGRLRLEFRWALPDLTEEMMTRLAADSDPRSATFLGADLDPTDRLDVRTITVSDPHLGERNTFRQIAQDPGRQQTSGFYANHPALVFGGLGIARRYGRIWTPAHLSRPKLVNLAVDLVKRTEAQLSREYDSSLHGYVRYFRHVPVVVDGRELRSEERRTFERLVITILEATKQSAKEAELDRTSLHSLVKHQRRLGLVITSEFECPHCGSSLGRCPDCLLPYEAKIENSGLAFVCPRCKRSPEEEQGFTCDCGEQSPFAAAENHLQIMPSAEHIEALREFLNAMDEAKWRGLFYIRGYVLKLVPSPNPPTRPMVALGDLRLWRVRAHHHLLHEPTGSAREVILRTLVKAQEKCGRNRGHPTHAICEQCLAEPPSTKQIKAGEVCLPRILGLAIRQDFDGVHHGYEIADVKYQDTIDKTDEPVKLGVHLKSRTRSKPKGLGRSVGLVKALYTQLFYSAYMALTDDRIHFDVIGISVPNTIHPNVKASMQRLVNQLGFSFLVINESEWVKIVDGVLEQREVEQSLEHVVPGAQ